MLIAISAFRLMKAVFWGEGMDFRGHFFFPDSSTEGESETTKRNVSKNNVEVFSRVKMGAEPLQRHFLRYMEGCGVFSDGSKD